MIKYIQDLFMIFFTVLMTIIILPVCLSIMIIDIIFGFFYNSDED